MELPLTKIKHKIAKIVPELLSSAQFRPSTIKKSNLVPKLYKWFCFHPYAQLAHHGGLPCQRRVNLGLYLVVKYAFYPWTNEYHVVWSAQLSVSWPGGPTPTSKMLRDPSPWMVDARGNTGRYGFILVRVCECSVLSCTGGACSRGYK